MDTLLFSKSQNNSKSHMIWQDTDNFGKPVGTFFCTNALCNCYLENYKQKIPLNTSEMLKEELTTDD